MRRTSAGVAVVTGAAGFLGSRLCRKLLSLDFEVIGIDNLVTGSRKNLADLRENERFRFLLHDACLTLPIHETVTHVFHLAAVTAANAHLAYPIETMEIGSQGTTHALELARSNDAKFMLASTPEVVGSPAIDVRNVYVESKRYAETITMTYCREYATQTHIARIHPAGGDEIVDALLALIETDTREATDICESNVGV